MPTTVTQSQQIRTSRAGTRVKPPEDIRSATKALISTIEKSWFDVSKNLYVIDSEDRWKDWGFTSMQDYVENELGYSYRTMRHRISVGRTLVNCNITQDQIEGIGEWTKLKAIRPLLEDENITSDAVLKLLEDAKEQSVRQLEEMVISRKTQSTQHVNLVMVKFNLTPAQQEAYNRISGYITNSTSRKLPGQILEYLCLHFELNEVNSDIMEWVVNNQKAIRELMSKEGSTDDNNSEHNKVL